MSERLSDGDIAWMTRRDVRGISSREHSMAVELQERRATDLTPEEIAVLHAWRADGRTLGTVDLGLVAVGAIDKILAAHGATP
jgi:hypothetical protein